MKIGIISDTHGLLRAEVWKRFESVEHILHAGDVGPVDLLAELETIAPLTAVWGNTDGWEVRERLPEIARVQLGDTRVVVVHGQQFGSPTPESVGAAHSDANLIVFGHSHRAAIRRVGSVLAVNPGSAGPPRFGIAPTLAIATLNGASVEAEILALSTSRR